MEIRAWDFQLPVPGYDETDMMWWNANGYDASGSKTEHNSPDTRPGYSAFIQGSTAGYYGHYYIHEMATTLDAAAGDLPSEFDASYYVYQGENDITGQIELKGDGLYKEVSECYNQTDALSNCDNDYSVKDTFEDIDGLEIIAASDGLYAVLQEDSGNELGERMFISSTLEHEMDGNEITYYFMAMSGGKYNTRMSELVGIPATTNGGGGSHEFSGIIDLSGMLAKEGGSRRRLSDTSARRMTKETKAPKESKMPKETKVPKKTKAPKEPKMTKAPKDPNTSDFLIDAHDGAGKRAAELMVPINDKLIALGLQAHNLWTGHVDAFKADRGGQVLLYQPNI